MKIYSIQKKEWINAQPYARSEFRAQDDRTCQLYFMDTNGLIHSQSLNYSILFTKALTPAEFKQRIKSEPDYHSITFH